MNFIASIPLALWRFADGVQNCAPGDESESCQTNFPEIVANQDALKIVLQTTFGIMAAGAVIYIIIASIRYTTSLGDPQATGQFRQSIIYAGVGLAVAVSAEIVVTFVLGRL